MVLTVSYLTCYPSILLEFWNNEMINSKEIRSVIFDFDGTLSSSRYFEPLGSGILEEIGSLVFGSSSCRWADPWMKGDLTSRDIASYLSKHLAISEEDILLALRLGSAEMTFNPVVFNLAVKLCEVGRKTALVTANMDVFSEVVVPSHKLDFVFDTVLNTSDYGTLDKRILWRKALNTFGPGFSFSTALLIEDNPRQVSLFRSLGGFAYQYKSDSALQRWLDITGFSEEFRKRGT